MTDTLPYPPDENILRRKAEHDAKPKLSVTVDKPINFRVGRTRPGTARHHYARKPRKSPAADLRNPTYY